MACRHLLPKVLNEVVWRDAIVEMGENLADFGDDRLALEFAQHCRIV